MKFAVAFLAGLASASGAMSDSKTAQLLAHARRLDDAADDAADDGADLTWLSDMAVKYQGCHHIKQWNTNADGKDDVKIYTKRLVRFRICPRDTCSASAASGCQSGYGDYIVDMDTYLNLYWEAIQEDDAVSCTNWLAANCAEGMYECADGQDDNVCQYQCAASLGREDCIEGGNPEAEQEQQIDVSNYLQCQKLQNQNNQNGNNQNGNNQNGNNQNGNNNNQNGQNNQVVYYAGPYCSEQGGAIKIGVFTDDSCTEFAGVSLYSILGLYTKYTDESLVKSQCTSCLETQADDANADSDADAAEDAPREMCTTLYETAGKCETYLSGTIGEDDINEQACNYMAGIKMVRTDGMLDVSDARPSAVATAFIVIFAMAFAAMAFYVWYLRTRLGVKKTSLL